MKKILTLFISFLMIIFMAGCATEYVPPAGGDRPNPSDPALPTEPGDSDDPVVTDDPNAFSVKLELMTAEGALQDVMIPASMNVMAQWARKDENTIVSVHTAKFNGRGVAKISGLDGDYTVTIIGLPDIYTYDPNSYTAANNKKNITVRIFELTKPSDGHKGTNKYTDIINFDKTGIYRAVIERADQVVYFQYAPYQNGVYTMTSMLDITANNINPILDVYHGNASWKPEKPTSVIDVGGVSGTFTKNFKWEFNLDNSERGNIFAFALRVDCLQNASFPVNIDFILERNGEFTRLENYVGPPIVPTEDFTKVDTEDHTGKTFTFVGDFPGHILDERNYSFNEETGYYQTADGRKLYVDFPRIDSVLNTLSGPNYYLGYSKNYNEFMRGGKGFDGYLQHAVNGRYPVTKELRKFLHDVATAKALFIDGKGEFETKEGGYMYSAGEDDMWLFACGYYN